MKENALLTAALLGMGIVVFTAGWWIGRTTTADIHREVQVGVMQQELAALREAGGARPATAKAPVRPDVQDVAIGDAPVRGPKNAPITIVEFSDFQCPFCARVNPTLAQIHKQYPDQVKIAFKHFPLAFHSKAMGAHKASYAAGNQGKFWEMHDLIFQDAKKLDPADLRARAVTLGLDMAKYDADVASPELEKKIEADLAQGKSIGVRGTPAFFVNGRFLSGAQPFPAFKKMIDAELARVKKG